jgi:lipopolysaccharide/colanic/teichoic acid biosynthesis glycosyltransferase
MMPVLLVVAAAARLTVGSPIVFRQRRVGRDGRPFTVFKFRTMAEDRRREETGFAGPDRRVCHKRADDPRHTCVGRVLRRLSLDELPQLWNVLRGDMSLVGPRPELVTIVETKYEAWQHERHVVKPGITGLWQVSARGNGVMYEFTDIDIEYVRSVSLIGDLKILARTFPALAGMRTEDA